MSPETFVAAHGYWILAIGCLVEGEMVLMIAAFAAHRGYLNPWAVLTIAFASAFAAGKQLHRTLRAGERLQDFLR